jgi:CubicO group peptidase (beta-lactamase class C family)
MTIATALTRNSLYAGMTTNLNKPSWDEAIRILEACTSNGQVRGATLYARIGSESITKHFGTATSVDKAFLLGSISKPIAIAALMTLFDQRKFALNDPVQKYLPEFRGQGREQVLMTHLMTHVSGLPDQLPENASLRSGHAKFAQFVQGAIKVPLRFAPGTQYEYSSMAIVLATEIAQRLSDREFPAFIDQSVLQPLGMTRSAVGMGRLNEDDVMPCQVEFGAVEAGGGSAESKNWDWNSKYWRGFGAPWGGIHASAGDVAKFLEAFLKPDGRMLSKETARLMIQNHNPTHLPSRGLGFDVGLNEFCKPCSERTFGHTGSTGTIAWADPDRAIVCVVLTTLPGNAVTPHPRQLASNAISNL